MKVGKGKADACYQITGQAMDLNEAATPDGAGGGRKYRLITPGLGRRGWLDGTYPERLDRVGNQKSMPQKSASEDKATFAGRERGAEGETRRKVGGLEGYILATGEKRKKDPDRQR